MTVQRLLLQVVRHTFPVLYHLERLQLSHRLPVRVNVVLFRISFYSLVIIGNFTQRRTGTNYNKGYGTGVIIVYM